MNEISAPEAAPAAPPAFLWDYAPAPERFAVEIAERYGLFIGGKFAAPKSRKHFATVNPATEAPLAQIAQAGPADVDAAVRAARAALPKWRKLPARERAKYLFRIARRIQDRARELAVLETMDGGKPIRESRDLDVPAAAQHFFYHAGWADKLEYAFPGREIAPVGVCAQIIPWNFPLLMAAWKIAPALACGNTVVLKPAETTSLTALRLAEILQEVELPPGVVNIVTGDGSTGAALAAHRGVDKIAFTGSTEVGGALYGLLSITRGRDRRDRETAHSGTRRQVAAPGLRRCLARSGDRGGRRRDLLQSRPRLLRRISAVRRRADSRRGRGPAARTDQDPARRRSARQEHRRRSDQLEGAMGEHRALPEAGR